MTEQTLQAEQTQLQVVPPTATFTLTLDKVIEGEAVLVNPQCEFSYVWDFAKNMGLAHLNSINSVPVNIVLHPLGIAGYLDFMSDMKPKQVDINGTTVTLFRVILDIQLSNNQRSAAIMFNQDGSCIEATSNFGEASLQRLRK